MRYAMSPAEFGKYLKNIRLAADLRLREVEEKTNGVVKNSYLSQIENGQINRPSPAILYELAQVYGTPYRELLIRAGHQVPEGAVSPDERLLGDFPLSAIAELDDDDRQTLLEFAAFLRQRKGR